MIDPDAIYDDITDDLEDAMWDEYRHRLNTDSIEYITESLSQIDYGNPVLQRLINNLVYEADYIREDESYFKRLNMANQKLGESLRALVKAHTFPDQAWKEDKERELIQSRVEDASNRGDWEYEQWKDRRLDDD